MNLQRFFLISLLILGFQGVNAQLDQNYFGEYGDPEHPDQVLYIFVEEFEKNSDELQFPEEAAFVISFQNAQNEFTAVGLFSEEQKHYYLSDKYSEIETISFEVNKGVSMIRITDSAGQTTEYLKLEEH